MEEQQVYSTNIRDNKCLAECITVSTDTNMLHFIVDTGAMFTCCNYSLFDVHLKEETIKRNETKYLGGFVKGFPVTFYKYSLKQFTIGTIDMGEQDIWITFDKRVTDTVLGMDILKQVIMITNPYKQKIYFCKDADDYERNFQLRAR